MTSISPLAPLSEILSIRLAKEDLEEEEGSTCDEKFLEKFEIAWRCFLRDRPALLEGHRGKRISQLQQQVKNLKASRESEELELKRQIAFLHSSNEALEEQYKQKLKEVKEKQHVVQDKLEKKLDAISHLEQLQQQTIPWQHFLSELNRLAVQKQQNELVPSNGELAAIDSKVAKPSARAMLLAAQTITDSESDVQFRACRIDNALLATHVTILQKEIEQYEKMVECREFAEKLLSENGGREIFNFSGTNNSGSETETTVMTVFGASQR